MSAQHETPWYVEAFLAIGGWVAGLIAAGAIFSFALSLAISGENADIAVAIVMVVLGGACTAYGAAAGVIGKGDFLRHFSVSSVSAGLTASAGGVWYLYFKALDAYTLSEAMAGGLSGLATAAILALAGIVITQRLRDAILAFLVTLAVYAVAIAALTILQDKNALGWDGGPYAAAAAAALGAFIFINAGDGLRRPLGAALMLAPAYHRLSLEQSWRLGVEVPHANYWLFGETALMAAALYALWRLRTRYPTAPLIASAIVLLAGVWLLPDSGAMAIVMLLAAIAANHRGLAVVAVIACAWSISRFYYDLSLTLLEKSAILAALGAVTIAGTLFFRRRETASAAASTSAQGRRLAASAAFGALLVLALGYINVNVVKLERAFDEAVEIYMPLGPVDPRSLMQGDYMQLNYRNDLFPAWEDIEALPRTGEVFLALDENRVARFSRVAKPGDAPGANEIRIDYVKPSPTEMRYAPESFFFQEGEADIFAPAQFAIVRVAPDGRARLDGLAGENLERLGAAR